MFILNFNNSFFLRNKPGLKKQPAASENFLKIDTPIKGMPILKVKIKRLLVLLLSVLCVPLHVFYMCKAPILPAHYLKF